MKYDAQNPDFSRIPDEMKTAARWVGWVDDKTPINPYTLRGASSTDAKTWAPFASAVAIIGRTATYANKNGEQASAPVVGIGFMLGGGWCGVDLDGGDAHGKGEVDQDTLAKFLTLNTYCEWSKSGEGYHFIGKYRGDKLNGAKSSDGSVEVYTGIGRYFAMTGNVFCGYSQLADITDGIQALHEQYIGAEKRRKDAERAKVASSAPVAISGSDNPIVQFMREHIDDALRCCSPKGENEWIAVGIALKSLGYTVDDFDTWSKREKYGGRQQIVRWWDSWKTLDTAEDAANILQNVAKRHGWSPETYTDWADNQDGKHGRVLSFDGVYPADGVDSAPASDGGEEDLKASAEENTLPQLDDVDAFMGAVSSHRYEPLSTEDENLDWLLCGGFVRQQIVLLSAAPGVGKTALTQQLFDGLAKHGVDCLYFCLEMSKEQMLARSFSRMAAADGVRMNASQVLQGYSWTDAQRTEMQRVAADYRRTILPHLRYVVPYENSLDALLQTTERYGAEAAAAGKDAPIVVVDYLHLLQGREREDDAAMLKRALSELKKYACKYNTVVFAISAQSRSTNDKGKVTMSAGRDTSALEYSADLQLGMTYTDCLGTKSKIPGIASFKPISPDDLPDNLKRFVTVAVTKARFGEHRRLNLKFDGETMTFKLEDLAERAAMRKLEGLDDSLEERAEAASRTKRKTTPGKGKPCAIDVTGQDETPFDMGQFEIDDSHSF